MKILDALHMSTTGRAFPDVKGSSLMVLARLEHCEAIVLFPTGQSWGGWLRLDEMPIMLKNHVMEVDWYPEKPKNPLVYLAEQCE